MCVGRVWVCSMGVQCGWGVVMCIYIYICALIFCDMEMYKCSRMKFVEVGEQL